MSGAILIVSRNNLHLTKAAVRTALLQRPICEVLVLDNASNDGTPVWLNSKSDIGLHEMLYHRQVSLSACWNAGLKFLFTAGYEQVLVCNNDVELRRDTYAFLSLASLMLDTPFTTAVGVGDREQMGDPLTDDQSVIITARPHPDFSCFLIDKSVPDRIGWFDESYFPAYCEDSDYHVRMHRAGIKAVSVNLPFYHAAAQTVKQADPGEQERIKRGADENRKRFKQQYGCLPGTPEYSALFT